MLKFSIVTNIDNSINKIRQEAFEQIQWLKNLGKNVPSKNKKIKNAIADELRETRNVVTSLNHKSKQLKVESSKTWLLYDEQYLPEYNRTFYFSSKSKSLPTEYEITDDNVIIRFIGKPKLFKVDEMLSNTGYNFLASYENYKRNNNNFYEPLISFRKKRKEIKTKRVKFNVGAISNISNDLAWYEVCAAGGESSKAYIHTSSGQILKLQRQKKMSILFQDKKPMNELNHVGIEIEFISKSDKVKLAELLYNENVHEFVCIKDDGSLRPEGDYKYTHEVCVVAPESIMYEVIERVLKAINLADSKVNNKCGLHVHLDMRNRNVETSFNNLVRSQNILYSMNPASRLSGKKEDGSTEGTIYSKKVDIADFYSQLNKVQHASGGRYYGVNCLSYNKHKTIEVRIHSGTINYEKISNWVKILVGIVNKSQDVVYSRECIKLETFKERFELDDTIIEYIKRRIDKFNKDGSHLTVNEAS